MDELLLKEGEEILRFWTCDETVVVLGKSEKEEEAVITTACEADKVPILRRKSGGGTVVLAKGCMNYSLVFDLAKHPGWRDVERSYLEILDVMAPCLGAEVRPPSDLVVNNRKVSGCAQHRTDAGILHHGSILLEFDAGLVERYLKEPVKQPPYREGRKHRDFLSNLDLARDEVERRITAAWTS